jgi:DNA polymerase III alpha subunit (gram-positive type)
MKSPYCNYISCDVETGGLINSKKLAVYDIALTEIALVAINDSLEIVEQKSWLIKPYSNDLEYNEEAAKVSGITKEMCVKQGQDIKIVCKEAIDFLKKYKKGTSLPIIFGHNFVNFDSEFISNMFELCKEDLMKYVNPVPEDTMKWARLCWTESTNYKLGTCCENAGITLVDAHRALTDTISTAKLWIYFMKNLRGLNTNINNKEEKRFRNGFEL